MESLCPRILMVSGPNLRMLGRREPEIYGGESLEDIEGWLIQKAQNFGVEIHCYQSESEGEIIRFLQDNCFDVQGIILNPGALTHYSIAIRDCITYLKCPVIEVHLSNIFKREEFRHQSVIAPVCVGQIVGLGKYGYLSALIYLVEMLQSKGELKCEITD
jgi:3-dehydroquinate dehydratase II